MEIEFRGTFCEFLEDNPNAKAMYKYLLDMFQNWRAKHVKVLLKYTLSEKKEIEEMVKQREQGLE